MEQSSSTAHRAFTGNIARKLYALVLCALLPSLTIILYSCITQRTRAIEETAKDLENVVANAANLQGSRSFRSL